MSRSTHHQRQMHLQQQLQQQHQQQQMAENDAAALAAEMFDHFCVATTMRQVLGLHRNMCDTIGLRPAPLNDFYPKLKAKIRNWKAQALWKKFDARASHRAYNKGNACTGMRVLVIGAGPCGLRTAIEAQLLGAKVVVVEKRDRISRNNVLHLWPFVITDLRNLGAKKFYGKFCAGSIDHISIRQLQCILLKVALLLGVEVHEGVSFVKTVEPSDGCGWRAQVSPEDHAVSHYEFDVLIGADGKRNTLENFKRKEFRGKLAIAITANFINKKTEAEAKAEEISGVAFIFNQSFFKELYQTTGIDLENIVYYKDETHYFVMTAKKHSLLDKGVIIQDFADPAELLAPANVNTEKLLDYAREAAGFSTKYQMPNLEFAVNHYGKPDVAMFDFTSMFAAEASCRVIVRKNYRLLQCLVGDSLLEPFWPTGSGCARGFLSSMDSAYAIKLWANSKNSILAVLAQRESIYRLLAQTTPENLQRDIGAYTVDPATRYPNLNKSTVNVWQVKHLLDADDKNLYEQTFVDTNTMQTVSPETPIRRKRRTGDSLPLSTVLLRWIKAQLLNYEFSHELTEVSDCFTKGKVLCSLINRYRPDLVDLNTIKESNRNECNELAFRLIETELGIPRVMSAKDSLNLEQIDSKIWLNYLEQVCELFRGEIPHVKHPKLDFAELKEKSSGNKVPDFSRLLNMKPKKIKSPMQDVDFAATVHRRSVLDEEKNRRQRKYGTELNQAPADTTRRAKKRRSHEKTGNVEERQQRLKEIEANRLERQSKRRLQRFQQTQNFYKSVHMLQVNTLLRESGDSSGPFEDYSIYMYRQQAPEFNDRVKELERKLLYPDRERGIQSSLPRGYNDEQFNDRIKSMEQRITSRNTGNDKKPRDLLRAIGKIESSDWNIREIEKKIEQSRKTEIGKNKEKVPKWSKEQFLARQNKMSKPLEKQDSGEEKFKTIDQTLKNLDRQLKEGSVLEVGQRGRNKVASIAGQFVKKDETSEEKVVPVQKSNSKVGLVFSKQTISEKCHFCKQTVYLMEKISTEGLILHRSCLKCHHCHTNLRLGGYAFDRDDPDGRFYCTQHFRLPAKAIRPQSKKSLRHQKKLEEERERHKNDESKNPDQPRGRLENLAQLDLLDRGQTPERIEFENADALSDGEPSLENIIDENEWTDRNFLSGSEDDSSNIYSSDSSDEESDSDLFEEANGSPIGAQTLQLATDWIGHRLDQKYSNMDDSDDEDFYDSSEGLLDDEADSQTEGEEFKKAREMRRQEVKLMPPLSYLPSDTETEVVSKDLTQQNNNSNNNNNNNNNNDNDNNLNCNLNVNENSSNNIDKNENKENVPTNAEQNFDRISSKRNSTESLNSRISNDLNNVSKTEMKFIENKTGGGNVVPKIDALNENLYNLNNLIQMNREVEVMKRDSIIKNDIMRKLSLKEKWLNDIGESLPTIIVGKSSGNVQDNRAENNIPSDNSNIEKEDTLMTEHFARNQINNEHDSNKEKHFENVDQNVKDIPKPGEIKDEEHLSLEKLNIKNENEFLMENCTTTDVGADNNEGNNNNEIESNEKSENIVEGNVLDIVSELKEVLQKQLTDLNNSEIPNKNDGEDHEGEKLVGENSTMKIVEQNPSAKIAEQTHILVDNNSLQNIDDQIKNKNEKSMEENSNANIPIRIDDIKINEKLTEKNSSPTVEKKIPKTVEVNPKSKVGKLISKHEGNSQNSKEIITDTELEDFLKECEQIAEKMVPESSNNEENILDEKPSIEGNDKKTDDADFDELELERLIINEGLTEHDLGRLLYDIEHKHERRMSTTMKQIEVKNFAETMDSIKAQIVTPKISKQTSLDVSKYFPKKQEDKMSSSPKNQNQKTLKEVDLKQYFPEKPSPTRRASVASFMPTKITQKANSSVTSKFGLASTSVKTGFQSSSGIISSTNTEKDSSTPKDTKAPIIIRKDLFAGPLVPPKPNLNSRPAPKKNALALQVVRRTKAQPQTNGLETVETKLDTDERRDSKVDFADDDFSMFDQLLDGAMDIDKPVVKKLKPSEVKKIQKQTSFENEMKNDNSKSSFGDSGSKTNSAKSSPAMKRRSSKSSPIMSQKTNKSSPKLASKLRQSSPVAIPKSGKSSPIVTPKSGKSSPIVTPKSAKSSPIVTPTSGKSNPIITPTSGKSSPIVTPKSEKSSPVMTSKSKKFSPSTTPKMPKKKTFQVAELIDFDEQLFEDIARDVQPSRSASVEYKKLFCEEKSPSEDISEKIEKILEGTIDKNTGHKANLLKAKSLDYESLDNKQSKNYITGSVTDLKDAKQEESAKGKKSETSTKTKVKRKVTKKPPVAKSFSPDIDLNTSTTDLEKTMDYLKREWRNEATNFLQSKRDSFHSKRKHSFEEKYGENRSKDAKPETKEEEVPLFLKPRGKAESFIKRTEQVEEVKTNGKNKKKEESEIVGVGGKKVSKTKENRRLKEVIVAEENLPTEKSAPENSESKKGDTKESLGVQESENAKVFENVYVQPESKDNEKSYKARRDDFHDQIDVEKMFDEITADIDFNYLKEVEKLSVTKPLIPTESISTSVPPKNEHKNASMTELESTTTKIDSEIVIETESKNQNGIIPQKIKRKSTSPKKSTLNLSPVDSASVKINANQQQDSKMSKPANSSIEKEIIWIDEEDLEDHKTNYLSTNILQLQRFENVDTPEEDKSEKMVNNSKKSSSLTRNSKSKSKSQSPAEAEAEEDNSIEELFNQLTDDMFVNVEFDSDEELVIITPNKKLANIPKHRINMELDKIINENVVLVNKTSAVQNDPHSANREKRKFSVESIKTAEMVKATQMPNTGVQNKTDSFPRKPLRRHKSTSSSKSSSPEKPKIPMRTKKANIAKLDPSRMPLVKELINKTTIDADVIDKNKGNHKTFNRFPTRIDDEDEHLLDIAGMGKPEPIYAEVKKPKRSPKRSPKPSSKRDRSKESMEKEYISQLEQERRLALIRRDELYAQQNVNAPPILPQTHSEIECGAHLDTQIRGKMQNGHAENSIRRQSDDVEVGEDAVKVADNVKIKDSKKKNLSKKNACSLNNFGENSNVNAKSSSNTDLRRSDPDIKLSNERKLSHSDVPLPCSKDKSGSGQALSESSNSRSVSPGSSNESEPRRRMRRQRSKEQEEQDTETLLARSKMLHHKKQEFMNEKIVGKNPYMKRIIDEEGKKSYHDRTHYNNVDNPSDHSTGIYTPTSTYPSAPPRRYFPTSRALEERRHDKRSSQYTPSTSSSSNTRYSSSTLGGTRYLTDYFKRSPSNPKERESSKDSCVVS